MKDNKKLEQFKKDILCNSALMREHFLYASDDKLDSHLKVYRTQFKKYEKKYLSVDESIKTGWEVSRQLEKDEVIWTAAAWKTLWDTNNRLDLIKNLLNKAFPKGCPLNHFKNWDDALGVKEDVYLFFEPLISSPLSYREHVAEKIKDEHLIHYIKEKSFRVNKIVEESQRLDLEGSTHVDALLINNKTGFNVFIEAKVLSDISYDVKYDMKRNQIARNLDVMIEPKNAIGEFKIEAENIHEKSLFLLLTPETFKPKSKNDRYTRLYAYKMNEYMSNQKFIEKDLEHRESNELTLLNERIGWITWENMQSIHLSCCEWLNN